MRIDITIVSDRTSAVAAAIEEAVGRAVRETAGAVATEARRRIVDGPASGRVYLSDTRPSPHQASAPGESPANWTGQLQSAIHTRNVNALESDAYVDEGEAPYAADLELGSPSARLAPRPFVYPAAEAERENFEGRVTSEVRRVTGS